MILFRLKIAFILLFLFHIVNCQSNSSSYLAKTTLVKVFVALRHGSRAPSYETYANDTYKKDDKRFWPDGPGELTKNGKQEAFMIGQKLRMRYSGFLGDYYNAEDFRVFSTLKERTMMSAQLVTAALFPPKGYQKWNNELHWQPLPVFPEYVINGTDDLNCKWFIPVSKTEMKNTPASEFGFDEEDIGLLQPHTGLYEEDPFTFMSKLWDVWDTIFFQVKENLVLPKWTKTLYPNKMTAAVLKFVKFYLFGSPNRKMVLIGPYGKALTNYFTNSKRKMEVHVWHDMNIIGILATLGAEIDKFPDPTATVAIELHRKNGKHYFEVYYYSDYGENQPKMMNISCGTYCSFNIMIKQLQTYGQINYKEICEEDNITNINYHKN